MVFKWVLDSFGVNDGGKIEGGRLRLNWKYINTNAVIMKYLL